jgi:hypothetical protein
MTGCTCPLASYCERHKVDKHEHWHRLCQTHEGYFRLWEDGRGPGQPLRRDARREARKRRIEASREQQKRLISWLRFYGKTFRPEDKGIGDTAHWLMKKSYKSKDANAVLERLLKQCSCSRADAVDRLNKKFPY